MTDVAVRLASAEDRLPIRRMLELYQHDLSDIWDQDLDAHGEFGYALDRFWANDGCHALVALAAGRYAGFALVSREVPVGAEGYWLEQFCVLKKYRGRGLGRWLAGQVFSELPGDWEVGQMPTNHAAQAFWRRVIGDVAGGHIEHVVANERFNGVVQCFSVPAAE